MADIRVLLADDHPLFRRGMRALLETEDDLHVVAEASGGAQALDLVAEHVPDVLVLDLEMNEVGGLQVARGLVERSCRTRILVVSAHLDDFLISEAVGLGLAGFSAKDETDHHLVAAVRAVAGGDTWMSPRVADRVRFLRRHRAKTGRRLLSRREVEVLRLVGDGLGNKQIAARLHLSSSTVKNHLANIFNKLEVGSRVEAVLAAQRMGYLLSGATKG